MNLKKGDKGLVITYLCDDDYLKVIDERGSNERIMNLKESSEPFEIEYQIFVDMGEDGTKTVYSSPDYQKAKNVLEEIKKGNFTNVDLYEDEFKEVQNISLMQTLYVPSNLLQTIVYDGQTEVCIELSSTNLE